MPLNRTPPSTPEPSCSSLPSGIDDSSIASNESPLNILTQRTAEHVSTVPSSSQRCKRKFQGEDDSDKRSIIAEMRMLFSNFTDQQDKKLVSLRTSIEQTLQDSIVALSSDLTELTKSLDFLSSKHEESVKTIERLQKERDRDTEYINSLERSVELLERKTRSSCIEIRNMPNVAGATGLTESKAQLCDMVVGLGKTLNTDIEKAELKDVYRQHSKNERTKTIMVEFTTVLKKESLLSAIKKFNRGRRGSDKLNSSHLHIKGPPKPIFVSESLTFNAKKLFFKARESAKEHGYSYCWTANGAVYLRKKDNMPLIRIANESDLSKLDVSK